jgi:hypothetical protein
MAQQVLASAQDAGLVGAVGLAEPRLFCADPQRHSWRLGTEACGGVLSGGSRQFDGYCRGRRRGDDPAGEVGVDEVREGVGNERGTDQEDADSATELVRVDDDVVRVGDQVKQGRPRSAASWLRM